MISNKYILLFFRLVVGGVFIWAGLLKIFDPLDFAQNIANYRIFSQSVSLFLALIIPWIEVICGLLLVMGIFRETASFMLSGSLVVFLALIIVTLIRGLDIECGCFGSLSRRVDYKLLLTDVVLLFFSLNIFLSQYSAKRKEQNAV
jgi:putative oxidoreductase